MFSSCREPDTSLGQTESKLHALLEWPAQAIIASGETGRVDLCNPATERMFGYTREELNGMPVSRLLPGSSSGLRKDGSVFAVEISSRFAEINGQRLTLIQIADVGANKRLEEHLREVQKLESIGLLAGVVAHDFNNLLTAILGNATLLADHVPAQMSRYLDAVITGAEKATHVARQLLAYTGRAGFQISQLDVSALVRDNAALIRVSIPKQITIVLDLPDNLPQVRADSGQIQQVLMNLILNAGEAIGEASGTIRISTGELKKPDGRFVQVTVSDTGCGMSEDTKSRIFEPFFTTKVHGRGLGMSAVPGILEACSGAIFVESAPGIGTTFRLLFPAAEAVQEGLPGSVSIPVPAKGVAVLVVDDEEAVRAFASAALRGAGYKVWEAAHGREAVDLIESGTPLDLVLLDVTMPVMGGRETLEHIRRLRPELRVTVTSGYGSEEVRRLMSDGGRHAGFLPKPYTAQKLLQFIGTALTK